MVLFKGDRLATVIEGDIELAQDVGADQPRGVRGRKSAGRLQWQANQWIADLQVAQGEDLATNNLRTNGPAESPAGDAAHFRMVLGAQIVLIYEGTVKQKRQACSCIYSELSTNTIERGIDERDPTWPLKVESGS